MPPDAGTVDKLVKDVEVLKAQMAENTEITKQVRDILGSFRIAGAIAKWTAAIVGGAIAVKSGWHQLLK